MDQTGVKPTWKRVKTALQKRAKQMRIETYPSKDQQSRFFREQEEEWHLCLTQKLHPRKTSSIMSMLEQMVETRSCKAARRLIEDGRCQVCYGHDKTVEHLVDGCVALSNSEYLTRHNRSLMILAVIWAKELKMIGADTVWYKEQWERGMVLDNDKAKLVSDFQFNLQKTETRRRSDLILETKYEKKIWICDTA